MRKQKGLTLIELLVVILIIGVLAAVAVPMYTGYLQRVRRSDAKTALEQLRAAQEMHRAERGWYANNGDYGNALTTLQNTWGVPANPAGDYNLQWRAGFVLSRNSFAAEAAPFTARQATDGSLFINHLGQKTPANLWAR